MFEYTQDEGSTVAPKAISETPEAEIEWIVIKC
jgi:hypothetical protein